MLSSVSQATKLSTLTSWSNVQDYGADPTGGSDSTTSIQSAINALAAGGTLFIPMGLYKLSAALTINKSMGIVGAGVKGLYGSVTVDTGYSINAPVTPPYLAGTILVQTASGTDCIQIASASAGLHVDLKDFGIFFGTVSSSGLGTPSWVSTGHGINVTPPTYGSYLDAGVAQSEWSNIMVFGHDGSHYAYKLTNSLLMTLRNLRHYGGGGLLFENDSSFSFYGNSLIDMYYGQTFVGGSAHGIYFKSTYNCLNLIQLNRPQVTLDTTFKNSGLYPGLTSATALTNSQYCFKSDPWSGGQYGAAAGVSQVSMIQFDFETAGTGLANPSFIMPTGPGCFIDPGGIAGGYTYSAGTLFNVFSPGSNITFPTIWTQWAPTVDNTLTQLPFGKMPLYPGTKKVPRPPAAAGGIGASFIDSVTNTLIVSPDGVGWTDTYAQALPSSLSSVSSGNLLLDLNFADAGANGNFTYGTGAQIATFAPSAVSDGMGSTGVGGTCTGSGSTKPQWSNTYTPLSVAQQRHGVLFDGANAYFGCTTTVPSGAFTDFYVLYPTVGVGANCDIIAGNGGASPEIRLTGQGAGTNPYLVLNSSSTASVLTTLASGWLIPLTQWSLITLAYDPITNHNGVIRVNSTPFLTVSGLTTTFTGTNTTQIGASNGSNLFNGYIARIVRFNGQLTSSQILAVERYLRAWAGGGI